MNKTCARCLKTVYPTEELKCLDKVWHKGCFKCQECGMTLNMRTYKGYGKLPYCEAHVPKIKATTMAETPELKRIAENTKIQSNVKYHADFEKSKGKCTQVANDPETLRITANSKIISNVAYHGDLEKKAAMEKQRTFADNGDVIDLPTTDNYHLQLDSYASEMLPPSIPPPAVPTMQQQNYPPQMNSHKAPPLQQSMQNSNDYRPNTQKQNERIDYINSNNYNMNYGNHNQPTYNSSRPNSGPNVQITSYASNAQQNSIYDEYENQNVDSGHQQPQQQQQQQQQRNYIHSYGDQYYQDRNVQQSQQRIGRIADYDPISDGPRNSPMPPVQGATVVYNSSQKYHHPQQQQQHQQPAHSHPSNNGRIGGHHNSSSGSRRIGSVADMDPLNDVYSSIAGPIPPHQQHMAPQHLQQMPPQHQQQMHPQHQQMSVKGSSNNAVSGKVYVAMYDYEAADSDEVSFREGDLIMNVSPVDEGWMMGRVHRTGHTGMLPANYVELAQI